MPTHGPDSRLALATRLIEETGMKKSAALLRAGYSPSIARRGGSVSVNMRRALQQAKDNYLIAYMERCKKNGTTPAFVADTVHNVMENGDFDQQMSAVGQHLKVILSRSDALLDHSPNVSLTVNQNFIVPQRNAETQWKAEAIESSVPARTQDIPLSTKKKRKG